jgi:DMSO/TMAO reductase YedYZ molybdopterin-dependent catalytic subunit
MTDTKAPPYSGKSPDLIPLGDGLNFSTPLAEVGGTLVPNPLFFLRSNNPPPTLAPRDWRVGVQGRVKRPLTLDLDALRAMPSATHEVFLECAGNSRRRFTPPGEGNQWDDQAVSDAQFKGASLADILELAGVEDDTVEVVTTGYDADPHGTNFQRGLPLEVARRPEVVLAYEMNGEPIPAANGGPVRLLVPRWAGIASVKWPSTIELTSTPFRGYYNAERYIFVDANGRTVATVREMPVKSVIARPGDGERLRLAPYTAFGFAWSGFGSIARVDVSTDNQQSWSAATLMPGRGPLAWTRWEHTWTPASPGTSTLAVRATDAVGNVQPNAVPWNKFGYLMNAILTQTVTVE